MNNQHSHYVPPVSLYLKVYVALLVLTVITVTIFINATKLYRILLLVLAQERSNSRYVSLAASARNTGR